jgi:hypothetical protein
MVNDHYIGEWKSSVKPPKLAIILFKEFTPFS